MGRNNVMNGVMIVEQKNNSRITFTVYDGNAPIGAFACSAKDIPTAAYRKAAQYAMMRNGSSSCAGMIR